MITKCLARSLPVAFMFATMSGMVQAGTGMNEEQMQQMMEQAHKMQECMAGIDQSALDALAARTEKMEQEVRALCDAGQRDQAQKLAMKYGKEISAAPVMKDLQKCGEMAKGMMQHMPMMDLHDDLEDRHVCDDMSR